MTDKIFPIRPGIETSLEDVFVDQVIHQLIRICDEKGIALMAIAIEKGETTIFSSQMAFADDLSMLGALEYARDYVKSSYVGLPDLEEDEAE